MLTAHGKGDELMKKIVLLLLTVILITASFTGCSNSCIFSGDERDDGSLPVKVMSVGGFLTNDVSFENVGYANRKGFYLTRMCVNGSCFEKKGYYVYSPVENYEDIPSEAKGFVVYSGICYVVTEENGKEYLTAIPQNTYKGYLTKYEAGEFKRMAIRYYETYGNTLSGGDGLIY